ncbi:MAG TPA: response regulator [Longimicrobium sp.]|nr:response regulator [Longimicrobium sp.]
MEMEMEGERSGGTAAVALVADMMFASRVRGTATAVGVEAVTVTRAEKLVEETRRLRPRVVLIDIDARGVDVPALIARLKSDPETRSVPVIAFGSHVNADALRAAREAGADRVLARSAFVRDLPALLGAESSSTDAS